MCNSNKRRILISPLNWGLGHATRLIPVIDTLTKQGHYCLLAGESPSIDVLREAFPQLPFVELHGFNVKLSKSNQQWFKIFKQVPTFFKAINKEFDLTQLLIEKYQIDLILSDNRYGVRSNNVASIIVTHQTQPHLGKIFNFFRPLSNQVIKYLLKKFDACWIPDFNIPKNLSGDLSVPIKTLTTSHLGILSRLAINETDAINNLNTDILVILSGPEPHRSQLEQLLLDKLINCHFKTTILRAKPNSKTEKRNNILLLPHCDTASFRNLICSSKYIICRSGYSTLMDLHYCNKKALLIPTPGQFEQEYLANRMATQFGFKTIPQEKLVDFEINQLLLPVKQDLNYSNTPPFTLPSLPVK